MELWFLCGYNTLPNATSGLPVYRVHLAHVATHEVYEETEALGEVLSLC